MSGGGVEPGARPGTASVAMSSPASPCSSLAPLLPRPQPPPPPRPDQRLRRSFSCHQFDPQWRSGGPGPGAGLAGCWGPGRAAPRFTDEEVFMANHPGGGGAGADYTHSKRK